MTDKGTEGLYSSRRRVIVVEGYTAYEREVVSGCKVCKADPNEPRVVSPGGIAHHSSGGGTTDCGKDATLGDWWWAD